MSDNPAIAGFGVQTLLGKQSKRLAEQSVICEPIVHHGPVERLRSLLDLPVMTHAAKVIEAWDGLERTARAWSPAGSTPFEIYPTKAQLVALYDAGCTVVLEGVERFVAELRPLCRLLERDLGVRAGAVNVEIFCAKKGGHGRPHFDPSFTFNCQIRGTKTWRLERHSSLQHPTFGMFLGRTPATNPDCHDVHNLPRALEAPETILAEPGTVVFLPPGVMHETRAEGETYAIAFAIESVDSVAARVLTAARRALFREPSLRAARVGPQFRNLQTEARTAVSILRGLAREIEDWSWNEEEQFRLRDGLSVERIDDRSVFIAANRASKTLNLDEAGAATLLFASERNLFTLTEAAIDLANFDAQLVEECVRQFANAGLLEVVKK